MVFPHDPAVSTSLTGRTMLPQPFAAAGGPCLSAVQLALYVIIAHMRGKQKGICRSSDSSNMRNRGVGPGRESGRCFHSVLNLFTQLPEHVVIIGLFLRNGGPVLPEKDRRGMGTDGYEE